MHSSHLSKQCVFRYISFIFDIYWFFFQIHHVLLYSIEGSFNPPCSKLDAFLKANWGNYNISSARRASKAVKHVSIFLKRIQGLKDQQWDNIHKATLENHEAAKLADSAEEDCEGYGSDDEDELLDPLYDDIPMHN